MSETGHAKNIGNLELMIAAVATLSAYNPNNNLITSASLQALLAQAQTALADTLDKNSDETVAINECNDIFNPVVPLVTRVFNAVEVEISDDQFSADVKTIKRKIQGKRTTAAVEDDPATPDVDESNQSHSASQMSRDNQIVHFDQLIALLKTNSAYNPNEIDLKITALEEISEKLKDKNSAFKTAKAAVQSSRNARDQVLYAPKTGLVDRAKLVKKYVKQVYGASSPEYRQISKLQFRKVK